MELREPDPAELEPEGAYGYCPRCECNVIALRMDFGYGWTEFWGMHSRHVDMRDVCPVCLEDVTFPPQADDEYNEED